MSRTNENKLKMKDIATIGIFSALLFVVTMVAGALMGISMVLNTVHPGRRNRRGPFRWAERKDCKTFTR